MEDRTRSIVVGVEFFERNNELEFKIPQHPNYRYPAKINIDKEIPPENNNLQWPTGFMYNFRYILYNYKIWNNR